MSCVSQLKRWTAWLPCQLVIHLTIIAMSINNKTVVCLEKFKAHRNVLFLFLDVICMIQALPGCMPRAVRGIFWGVFRVVYNAHCPNYCLPWGMRLFIPHSGYLLLFIAAFTLLTVCNHDESSLWLCSISELSVVRMHDGDIYYTSDILYPVTPVLQSKIG